MMMKHRNTLLPFTLLRNRLIPSSWRSFHASSRYCNSLGGTITVFRTPTIACRSTKKSSASASSTPQEETKHGVELKIRQQFTGPPGGFDPRIDSTGRFVWPTASALLDRIHEDFFLNKPTPTSTRRLRVLELGSGCGLLGMGLAATGLVDAVLTDHDGATEWLEGNVELNRDIILQDRVTVAELTWGDSEDAAEIELNHPPFDLIVGSDIVYDQASHRELVETMRRFSIPCQAPVYIAYPRRKDEDPFLAIAGEYFHVEVLESITTAATAAENSLAILSCKLPKD